MSAFTTSGSSHGDGFGSCLASMLFYVCTLGGRIMKPTFEPFTFNITLNEKQAAFLRKESAHENEPLEVTANVLLRLAINSYLTKAEGRPNGNLPKR